MFERDRIQSYAWPLAIGAGFGIAAGLLLAARRAPLRLLAKLGLDRELGRTEGEAVDRLARDDVLGRRGIEVAALAPGIVELSGRVRDDDEAHRAIQIVQRVPGVRTVLNRLELEVEATHLEQTRLRFAEGDAGLHETHWYGLGVGTGRRRQGDTDPDRPDDRVSILSRELGTNRAVEQTSEILDKLPSGVEGHSTLPAAPTDRGAADAASHRRLGNVPAAPLQDLNPAAGVHENVAKGTRVRLEASGLEEELRERGVQGQS
ncbi:MAG: BON domain-containing protein [Gemmatimonadetes bacterium]|nr:BON domain-containing protein [Gemmatimonadota bacterium]